MPPENIHLALEFSNSIYSPFYWKKNVLTDGGGLTHGNVRFCHSFYDLLCSFPDVVFFKEHLQKTDQCNG